MLAMFMDVSTPPIMVLAEAKIFERSG